MKITVLGTGMVGRAIAEKLLELGHSVSMGTRDVEKTRAQVKENFSFAKWLESNPVQLLSFEKAGASAESLLINCTAGMASMAVLNLLGAGNLKGKILMDIANPLDFSQGMPPSLNPGNTDSLSELIQRSFPDCRVVKCLNTMNCNLMVNPSLIQGNHSVFVCGNNDQAKNEVKSLLNSFGWKKENILDLGDISAARGTEQILPLWLKVMAAKGTPMFNFSILS